MWRWSLNRFDMVLIRTVFSTYVEVILCPEWFFTAAWSILHVCGGDPSILFYCPICPEYSPRMWRWSSVDTWGNKAMGVFSTYVEVIPNNSALCGSILSILHVCGGDPEDKKLRFQQSLYSPRMWRWSCKSSSLMPFTPVFSTYVEVIL